MNGRRVVVIGVLALAALAAARAVVLLLPGTPSGIDGGNWLAFGTFARTGLVYPPVVPAVFAAAVGWVGPTVATSLAGSVSATLPGVAVLAVLAWARHPVAGLLAGLAVAASGCLGEIAAWGGYPQPLALAAAVIALTAATAWLTSGERRTLAVFVAMFALVVATSHLVAVPSLVAVAVSAVAVVLRQRAAVRRVVALAVGAVAPFVVLISVYAPIIATAGQPAAGQGDDVVRVLGGSWPLDFALLLAAPAVLAISSRWSTLRAAVGRRDVPLLAGISGAGITWAAAYLVTREPRLLYDIYALSVLAGATVLSVLAPALASSTVRRATAALLYAVVVALVATGLARFPAQVDYYRVLGADRYRAVEWMAAHPPTGSGAIVVADVSGVPIGWWVEGIVGREVLYASDLRWLRFPSERDRATIANTFLYRTDFPSRESASSALSDGIAYVFLPSAGAFGVDPSAPPPGWAVAYSSADAAVLEPSVAAAVRGHDQP